ncbi:hypothetical protein BCR33DRAFT_848940 [Rhizoclosmatium globosum]|uniref:Uncharacterized protein n=1 Tax=Rhizoclosmatium globosum TaxID=329046 RepID=A0A1Y2CKQ2_9FUNG|nr:hypothetical protein BCR33DRAFT_848940 [Rhizoclosmatium globosum]|eukprot:ORY46905.1 hypothetical protein BCR33DRAFT_848940 [Rhizoclosmatium globosum]
MDPPPSRARARPSAGSKSSVRPMSMFAASPLRASVTPAVTEDPAPPQHESSPRRLSGHSFLGIRKSGNSTREPSRDFSNSSADGASLFVTGPGSDGKKSKEASRQSSLKTKEANMGSMGKLTDSPSQPAPRRNSKTFNPIAMMGVGRKNSKKKEEYGIPGYKLANESRDLECIGSGVLLDNKPKKQTVIRIKPVLRVVNPDVDEMISSEMKPQLSTDLLPRMDSTEFPLLETAHLAFNSSTGSLKQMMYISPHRVIHDDFVSETSSKRKSGNDVRDSMVTDDAHDDDDLGSSWGDDVRRFSNRLSVVSTHHANKRESIAKFSLKENDDGNDEDSIKNVKLANKALHKAIDTFKANNTKNGLGWGELMLINGTIQAIVLGCLESYVFWSVWKFIDLSWGATSGNAQFYLVYFGLFVLAEIFMALGLLDAAWNKNSMQVIACILFNFGILSYSFIQINHIRKIQICAESFIAVYAAGPYPFVFNQTQLYAQDQSTYFNLMGTCPWTLDPNAAERLTESLKYLRDAAPVELVICGISGLGNLMGMFFGYKTYQEYGWSMYQVQGASIERKWIMTRYHLFILVLKFNIFFTLGFVSQMVAAFYYSQKGVTDQLQMFNTPWILGPTNETTVIMPNDYTKVPKNLLLPLSIVAIVAASLSYLFGWNAIRKCNKLLMLSFLGLLLADFAAVVYGLQAVFTDKKYEITKDALALFCFLQIIINLVTWIIGFQNIRDFDKGLKDLLYQTANIDATGNKMERKIFLD